MSNLPKTDKERKTEAIRRVCNEHPETKDQLVKAKINLNDVCALALDIHDAQRNVAEDIYTSEKVQGIILEHYRATAPEKTWFKKLSDSEYTFTITNKKLTFLNSDKGLFVKGLEAYHWNTNQYYEVTNSVINRIVMNKIANFEIEKQLLGDNQV